MRRRRRCVGRGRRRVGCRRRRGRDGRGLRRYRRRRGRDGRGLRRFRRHRNRRRHRRDDRLGRKERRRLREHLAECPALGPGQYARALEAAGIPYRDDAGLVADFHCLRHTFITNLAADGVHPKTAQALARHSTITLTMDRYSHSLVEEQTAALEVLPNLTGPATEAARRR
mgnify:CR=1 FL=1